MKPTLAADTSSERQLRVGVPKCALPATAVLPVPHVPTFEGMLLGYVSYRISFEG